MPQDRFANLASSRLHEEVAEDSSAAYPTSTSCGGFRHRGVFYMGFTFPHNSSARFLFSPPVGRVAHAPSRTSRYSKYTWTLGTEDRRMSHLIRGGPIKTTEQMRPRGVAVCTLLVSADIARAATSLETTC